jgi:hypothetical protein
MTHAVFAAWVLAAIQSVSPPHVADLPTYPSATETREERAARLEAIAEDIAAVALREDPGALGSPKRVAAYLIAVASLESGFARDVDLGPCDPQRIAKRGCDGGRAKTLWQLHGVGGWPTRQEAARRALGAVRLSLRACQRLPASQRLALYASGSCHTAHGRRASVARVALAERLASR